MTWKSITQEEKDLIMLAIKWLEVRKRWDPGSEYYSTEADLSKSALFERMRNGLEPLDFPPPIGFSCPWYAIVEDPGPHIVGYGGGLGDIHFSKDYTDDSFITRIAEKYKNGTVVILQHTYEIFEQNGEADFIIRDTLVDPEDTDVKSPYFFRLYWNPDHEIKRVIDGKITRENIGAWLMYNTNFNL